MAKIPVAEIWLHRAEGPTKDLGQVRVTSFDQADEQLRRWARTAPKKGGGYDKTDFKITWADGETYDGRYDLQGEDVTKSNLLGSHIQHYLNFHAGLFCPEHMTREQYELYLEQSGYDDEKKGEIIEFMRNYEI